jgi:lauroyl/myristoyl acyltransferase
MGRTIYLQNGPARLARLTGACLVPAAIEYDPAARRHQLFLYPMLDPQQLDPQALTQKALDCIGPHVQRRPAQQFYDLLAALEQPQQTA